MVTQIEDLINKLRTEAAATRTTGMGDTRYKHTTDMRSLLMAAAEAIEHRQENDDGAGKTTRDV